MFIFVFLSVVFTVEYSIEKQVEMCIQRYQKHANIQNLDAQSAKNLFFKIAGIQGMICMMNS